MSSKKQLRQRILELEAELAFLIGSAQTLDECEQRGIVIRPWAVTGSGSTTVAPWCGICQGFHIPGNGACTATWSLA